MGALARSCRFVRSASLFVAVVAACALPAQEDAPAATTAVRPGPEHELLAYFAGAWDAVTFFRAGPGEEPMEGKGGKTHRLRGGGLWLLMQYDSAGEEGFEGNGAIGYDLRRKKYVGGWLDSMSSSLHHIEGSYDKATQTFTYRNRTTHPATGEEIVYTSKETIRDQDHHTYTVLREGPEGKEYESLRIEYTRRKEAPAAKRDDPRAQFVGTWSTWIQYGEGQEKLEYTLRIAREGEKLTGVLVSPRSGEHPFRSVEWKNRVLSMEIDRQFDDWGGTFEFEARLLEGGVLEGEVSVAGAAGFEGKWRAEKK